MFTHYKIALPLTSYTGYGSQANKAQDAIPIINQFHAYEFNHSRLHIPYITVTDSVNGIYL